MDLTIRAVTKEDADSWLRLRCALWPEGAESEHRREIEQFFAGDINEPQAVWLAFDAGGRAVGCVEISIRSHAEGCLTNRILYLEGWYVVPEMRRKGIGRTLVEAAATWRRAQGCIEFGSDTEPDNEISRVAHHALGFQDGGLVRCFRKAL